MTDERNRDRLSAETRAQVERLDRRVKIGLLVVSGLTIVLLVVAALGENVFTHWRQVRRGYTGHLKEKGTDDFGRSIARNFAVEIDQNVLLELARTDRCTTCHTGVDDPRMVDAPQPYTTHPGDYLAIHEPAKFGCTVCHEGQGRATSKDEAHGTAPFWDYPMHREPYMKSGCTKCHAHDQLYGTPRWIDRADGEEAGEASPSTRALSRGWRLIERHGCLGCHVLDGKGGTLGPELTRIGEKTHHEFSFAHMSHHDHGGPRRVTEWLEEHFLDPAGVSPGSSMPKLDLSRQDAEALTAVMLSLRSKNPTTPFDVGAQPELSGGALYGRYCSSCHGADGGPDAIPGIRTPSLANRDMLAVADDGYLRRIIATGRSGTAMPAWGEHAGGLSDQEIDRIIQAMRAWEAEPAQVAAVRAAIGDPEVGRAYYQGLCANCHGAQGDGGIGVSLSSDMFLAVASDRFLAETIIHGRPGTAMPSWKSFSAQAVSDLVAYIRTWEAEPPTFAEVRGVLGSENRARLARDGEFLYRRYCTSCHQAQGKGGIGPAIGGDDFLRVVSNRYLYRAIVEGRPGTGMPAWRHLQKRQVAALIALVRSWQRGASFDPRLPVEPGDYLAGEVHYEVSCSQCHGPRGSGGSGPQLTNEAFLSAVSDGQLYQWIAHGRGGTAMQGFLPEEQGSTTLSAGQIADVIAYLRFADKGGELPLRRLGAGDARSGNEIYQGTCAGCHGVDGEGASGPQLANSAFLRTASDGFLAATIILGRDGSPMRSMVHGLEGLGQVDPARVPDLVALIRSWDDPNLARRPRLSVEMSERSIADGRELYATYCASCHGPEGRSIKDGFDYYAPALNNRDFLDAASDGFLLATIARGRRGTPMRPFGQGAGGMVELNWREIEDIVSFMRSWQTPSVRAQRPGVTATQLAGGTDR